MNTMSTKPSRDRREEMAEFLNELSDDSTDDMQKVKLSNEFGSFENADLRTDSGKNEKKQ